MSIEVGKQYVIVNSRAGNNGKRVTVVGYAGRPGLDGCDTWAVFGDRWRLDVTLITNHRDTIDHIGEKQLKPIDDDDSRKVGSWEELKDIWVPPLVGANAIVKEARALSRSI